MTAHVDIAYVVECDECHYFETDFEQREAKLTALRHNNEHHGTHYIEGNHRGRAQSHGLSRYIRGGCRCDICSAARRAHLDRRKKAS